jgi:hypothetical protein
MNFSQLALAGQYFFGVTPVAGVDLPVSGGTAQTCGLWNPSGSGVYAVIDRVNVNVINATTPVISGLMFDYLPNAGSAIGAAGAPITAFTQTASLNAIVNGGTTGKAKASVCRFTNAATTIATTALYALGISHESVGTTAVGWTNAFASLGGTIILPPGVALFLVGSAAQTQNLQPTLSWAEVPVS